MYRLFVFLSIVAVAAGAAFGLAALAPGVAAFPFFFLILLIPALAFMAVTYQVIYDDTIRRVANRGKGRIASIMRSRGRNLDQVEAANTNFARLNLEGFSMQKADLHGSRMNGTHATGVDMSKANVEKARMSRGIFRYGRFVKSKLGKSRMRYADFTGANFQGADLRKCNLKGANLKKANLNGALLQGAVFNKKTTLPFDRKEAFSRGMVFI